MGSIDDIMQLCRLCLVKDQVNIPIFDETSDIRQTFLKINQCLPVKVSRDDNLPKKICDGCSYKLDMLYVFRNTSVDSEKQLVSWLSQLGSSCSLPQTMVKDGATKPEIMVKQETFETTDARLESDNGEAHQELGVDAHSYIIQQQKLPYQQDFAAFGEPSGSTVSEEPPAKKPKRAAATKKHVPVETEEDTLETAMQITKAEQEEDSDDIDQPDYVEAPSTSADDQPGPSGVGKGTIEAPILLKVLQSEKRHLCHLCPKFYTSANILAQHLQSHLKTFKCDQCDKILASSTGLRRHKIFRHSEERNFVCRICSFATKTKRALEGHIILIHTKEYPHKCDLCGAGYLSRARVQYHKQSQHEGHRFTCQQCPRTFRQKQSLTQHIKNVHEATDPKRVFKPKFMCDVCGKQVIGKRSLRDHKMTHSGEKPFLCGVCGKSFNKKGILNDHMRVHTKEMPYQCDFCMKMFRQKSSLNVHMMYHTGERPHKCENCGKEFIRKYLLNNHSCN